MNKHSVLALLAVGVGGALGTMFRYFINILFIDHIFPFATLLVNNLGSFLLGILTGWFMYSKKNEILKVGLGTGFCGGFTTMSTFAADFFILASTASDLFAFIYIVTSIFGGIGLAFCGMVIGVKISEKYREEVGEQS